MWHVNMRKDNLGFAEPVAFPAARGVECDAGALLLYDEFGKVLHAIAPGSWVEAWQDDQPTPGDPSIGGTP